MNESTGGIVSLVVTSGLAATIGSVLTATIQGLSRHGESRAVAADRVSNAAGNLADRLDKMNLELQSENSRIRLAIVKLIEAVEEMLEIVDNDEVRSRIQSAVREARLALL